MIGLASQSYAEDVAVRPLQSSSFLTQKMPEESRG